ncbi:hypothetical protein MKW92_009164, partial [Papaver armeniacum]
GEVYIRGRKRRGFISDDELSSGVIGCLKKTQNWCLPAVGEQHQRFAGAKARTMTLHA